MKFLTYFIFSVLIPNIAFGVIEPKIINSSSLRTVDFGERMDEHMKKNHPDFKLLSFNDFSKEVRNHFKKLKRQLPMADLGDFNGDSKKDAVVLGKEKNKFVLLAIMSSKKSFQSQKIKDWTSKDFNEVFKTNRGIVRYISSLDRRYITNPKFNKDVFQLETYMGFTELLYYEGGKFKINKGRIVLKP